MCAQWPINKKDINEISQTFTFNPKRACDGWGGREHKQNTLLPRKILRHKGNDESCSMSDSATKTGRWRINRRRQFYSRYYSPVPL